MKAEIAHKPVVLDQCLKRRDSVCWPKVKQKSGTESSQQQFEVRKKKL